MSQESNTQDRSFPEQLPADPDRRFWLGSACAMGGVAAVATAVPFVASMTPSDRARAAGAPVSVNLDAIAPGTMVTVQWQGKPVWIIHRTQEQIDELPKLDPLLADPHSDRPGFTPEAVKNTHRSLKPEWMVCVGICTHLGCAPTPKFVVGAAEGMSPNWQGGFFCPCHGSAYDMAGRVFKNQPAPDNLLVPPYYFIDDHNIMVGLDKAEG